MRMRTNVKIVPTDFKTEDQDTVNQLADILNPVLDDLGAILNSGITVSDNMNWEYKTFVVKVDDNGVPNVTKFPLTMRARPVGFLIVNIKSGTGGTSGLKQMPFIEGTFVDNVLQISNIYGLTANVNYTFTLLITAG